MSVLSDPNAYLAESNWALFLCFVGTLAAFGIVVWLHLKYRQRW